jgi:hypothetical protein
MGREGSRQAPRTRLLSEQSIRLGLYWVLGGIFMAFGLWIAFFSIFRHWEMRRIRKTGRSQYISGTPMAASLFFLVGWAITPLAFSWWMFLILLAEGPAFVTILPADDSPPEA